MDTLILLTRLWVTLFKASGVFVDAEQLALVEKSGSQPTNQSTSQPWFVMLDDFKPRLWHVIKLACKILENLKIGSHKQVRVGSSTSQAGLYLFILFSTEVNKYWQSPEQCNYKTYRCYTLKKSETFLMLLPRTTCTCQCDYLFIFNVWALG